MAINDNACGASCVFAYKWKGMSTNGGCRCLRDMTLEDRQRTKKCLKEYKKLLDRYCKNNDDTGLEFKK